MKLLDEYAFVHGSDELLYAIQGNASFSLSGDGQQFRRWMAERISHQLADPPRAPSTGLLKDVVELAIARAEQGKVWQVCRRLARAIGDPNTRLHSR